MQSDILSLAILEMCRMRRGSNFCPSEVVRWMYPQDWRHFMEDVRISMMDLYRQGKIVVTQGGIPVGLEEMPKGPVRIQGFSET
ncbi:DUF3253 domain-containing protein [Mariniradius sediminis]|uniref:DUF3253 domain-containing protein n=1 Tax=Mariniradius sediminis TaxID=2909237 RepID=A0ABS9BTY7_9BACT|nr:DUF3253 domain-containing protein [Mariniradius sediminis]MCF1751509.1 DUF3253 domain-containing protein [Mariniradius sediminis]